jgi:hypothetical protein
MQELKLPVKATVILSKRVSPFYVIFHKKSKNQKAPGMSAFIRNDLQKDI